MAETDLILLHAPSVYDFRSTPVMYGPVSDVVPSSQIFDMYPIGFMTILKYLEKHGFSVRIINIALRMLKSRRFNVEKMIKKLKTRAFGLDLHWLVHAQGSLEIAGIIKKYHPQIPVIFGGLSSSYFHKELIQYSQVDYVLRGDSTEEPLNQLLKAIKQKREPENVANLTWKKDGRIRVNDFNYSPPDLNSLDFDYRSVMKSTVKHLDLFGHIPFIGWIKYPIVAAFFVRGCVNNCIICGGSANAFRLICKRKTPAFRSPELLAADIKAASGYLRGPVIILGDIFQAGNDYAYTFLHKMKELNIKNHIAIEFFYPPPPESLEKIKQAIPNFNLQMSPESHDETIRKSFGRNYDNNSLEQTIKNILQLGCRRVDLFFMTGLPGQTPQSVMDTVKYCGYLMGKYGHGKIHPYISPLAPFLDPGSMAFENPEKYGYRLFYHTLEEHRRALTAPSWKYTLNYETKWMNRDELVSITYKAAHELNRLKVKYGLLRESDALKIEKRIKREMEMITTIDSKLSKTNGHYQAGELNDIMKNYHFQGHSTMCKKDKMKWPYKFFRFNILKILKGIVK